MTHPADTAKSEELKLAYPSLELCVQFSEDGRHIRKWSRLPFDGGTSLYSHPASPPPQNDAGVEGLTDAQILKIASNPICSPCSPWWLKDDVLLSDVRQAAVVFARAIIAALRTPMSELQALGQEFEAGEKDIQQKADTFAGAMFIASADSEGEFVAGDDGYMVYWPKGCHGAFNAWTLRLFADELDRRNADWDRHFNDHNPLPSAPSGEG
ncbi:hypothetical protein M527_06655 [Sphingobium indicum IP26]|uniref:Uncharacterized protein n=1 Tax=Sphingobium indicum F2 TaxID=1450518 RepID=A0A8E0WU24_9SPHN|nr:hypothetical protein [Sphingobium indicum]EPR09803.1 hypothetical protein M527_06655 [Sphingobium indicum IP26]KER37249.1 hypothetical protein AL00_06130 [Sphingobium indicum F2]